MNEFQNGAFKLAIQEKKPILPIVIDGTRDAIPRGSWLFKTKVNGKLTVLPLVETKDLRPEDSAFLKETVHKKMKSLIA